MYNEPDASETAAQLNHLSHSSRACEAERTKRADVLKRATSAFCRTPPLITSAHLITLTEQLHRGADRTQISDDRADNSTITADLFFSPGKSKHTKMLSV